MHEWGNDAVAKVPVAGTPDAWICYEATYCEAVHLAGAPAPEFLGFEEVDGRTVSIYRRALGPVMWDDVVAEPTRAEEHGRRLAAIQASLTGWIPPVTLPRQIDRLRSKVRLAGRLDPALAAAAAEIPVPSRLVICHGDLHPSNVILTSDGPVVVDWFDASRGEPIADVARTLVLLDGTSDVAIRFRGAYLDAATSAFDIDARLLARWRAVTAVARICEGFDPQPLLAQWNAWLAERATTISPAGR